MLQNEKIKKILSLTLRALATLAVTLVAYYFVLPPLNVHSPAFWGFLVFVLVLFGRFFGAFRFKPLAVSQKSGGNKAKKGKSEKSSILSGNLFSRVTVCLIAIPALVLVLGGIFSSTFFHAKSYASVITVNEQDFKTDMPEISEVTNIALMDTESAKILGNRELGALANVVSQYVSSENYTQINYHGRPVKVANLEYAGFFKWLNNRESGIPGYIMVDAIANTSQYRELSEGMLYAESGYFGNDLVRKLRFDYPTKIFDNISFEVDENGKVFYIVSCAKPRVGLFGARDIEDVILFDPVSGESELCTVAEVPTWVDIVYDGYLVCEKYDWHGTLSGGFWNSVIGNKGCKKTTADFGYIMLNDDVWYFTGVTSVNADASNIGFILSCARTGEYKFYPVIGAEEYSAMGAAEGEVQEKGYVASFPSLVNIAGEPTYIMVLKDANNLVKLYALVNVQQYNIVATGETQAETVSAYLKLLSQNGVDTSQSASSQEADVTVADLQYLTRSGMTYVYITATDGKVYSMEFNDGNEAIVLAKVGSVLHVSYFTDAETQIRRINTWSFPNP